MNKERVSLSSSPDYRNWLVELKSTFRRVQIKAAVAVNRALLEFYWQLGRDIVDKQLRFSWGEGFFKQLSRDLQHDFPEVKGFSARNLQQIRQWYVYWNEVDPIALQLVAQLCSIPWGHISLSFPSAISVSRRFIMCNIHWPTAGAAVF